MVGGGSTPVPGSYTPGQGYPQPGQDFGTPQPGQNWGTPHPQNWLHLDRLCCGFQQDCFVTDYYRLRT